MWRDERIAVVVPAYNEARLIAGTLDTMPDYVDAIVVVDDASQDPTGRIAEAHPDPRVVVERHAYNRGVGAAISTGYQRAFADGADIAVVMAGDGQMCPRDLPALLDAIADGADYAKGDRLARAELNRRMPWTRLLGNHALSMATRWVTGLRVSDSQCGYTALHRRGAARLPLHDLWPRYGYPNDLLARCAEAGIVVRDVPVRAVYEDEVSGVTLVDALVVVPFVLLRAANRRAEPAASAWAG